MKRPPKEPVTVADLSGGELVETYAGVVRITGRCQGGGRWARLILEGGRECRDIIDLSPVTRVLRVLEGPRQSTGAGAEVDPLRGDL